ncbi:hypothetical protein [Psychrobacter urativorans]|uniref:hypothetical protein n=1 Tax=Psychrobacter urativorans TaxID=45610 RepID=UPI0019196D04|nr:hypothetical protein [Psychrobacter urativorans]
MKLTNTLVLSILFGLSILTTIPAQADETQECIMFLRIAEDAIKNRQNDVSIIDSFRGVDNMSNGLVDILDKKNGKDLNERAMNTIMTIDATARLIVEMAYEEPYGYSQQMKNRYIAEFTNNIYSACMKDKRQ